MYGQSGESEKGHFQINGGWRECVEGGREGGIPFERIDREDE